MKERAKLFEMFKTLEFRRLAEEFSPAPPTETQSSSPIEAVDNQKAIDQLIKEIIKQKRFCVLVASNEEEKKDNL